MATIKDVRDIDSESEVPPSSEACGQDALLSSNMSVNSSVMFQIEFEKGVRRQLDLQDGRSN